MYDFFCIFQHVDDLLREHAECKVSKLHELIDSVTSSYDKFNFGDAGRVIYDFFWGDFADW